MTDDTVTVRHVHRASPEVVFACLTTVEHLTRFWGPVGTRTPPDGIVVDLRPGGAFETVMVSEASGDTHTMRAEYVEVSPPTFVSWREAGSGVLTEVTLADGGDGTTEVVTTQRGLPPHLRVPEARAGWETALDRFATYVAELATQQLVGTQLRALADALDGREADWAGSPSLCEGWDGRHVLAHVTMAARYDPAAFGAEMAAAGGDFGRLSETIARRDGELPLGDLLADLRSATLAGWAPPGGGATGALSHAVIHGLDITHPSGLGCTADDRAVRRVLDTLTVGGVSRHFGVDPAGHRLVAADLDWAHGDGVALEAPAVDLLLALSGRRHPSVRARL